MRLLHSQNKPRRRQLFHLMQTDRFLRLQKGKDAEEQNKTAKFQSTYFSSFYLSPFSSLFLPCFFSPLFRILRTYISNTYFRRKAPCEKYFAFRTSMYLYVKVLLYANKQYGIFVMFEFNFFVFNLSPWPFLESGEQLSCAFFCASSPYIW